ncbi:HTH tetR-type domain-containing protein [Sphingomonas antarctica]|uniref:TetR/AcrR family transcriptional regulator n=1 Tax=Sphingomonas antarctica TaxID=2040274 RepID=UPI0039E854AD
MAGLRGPKATDTPTVERSPRTERGRKTRRTLLDAAAVEFGERGFHDSSIVGITQRAGVALGSFYTYFESKEALFRALVADMSARVGDVGAAAAGGIDDVLEREQAVTSAFIAFATEHKELYRIIDEAEFVDPATWRAHYENAAGRIAARLRTGAGNNQVRSDVGEVEAWALMGMNVFLGLRFGVWGGDVGPEEIGRRVAALLREGLAR